jgi:aryl-alcohol dehydrogenase-like predicted oxidoreductase
VSIQPTAAAAGTIDVGGDLTVNRMGFGAMRITGSGIWGDPASRDQAIATLRRVVELGVNFIDTADSYGPDVSETLIAEAFHPYPDDLVIATKGGLVRPGPNRWEADGRPEHLRQACEGSLRRLRLEQIPLYQFHRPDPAVPLAESIGAIAELKNEGKIRHVGLSNVSESQLREAQAIVPIVSVQNRYNVSDRRSESMIDLCEQERLVFLPWAPIQETDRNVPVRVAAERLGVTPHQVVLAWLLATSPQMLPIPGTGSPDHAAENIAAASVELTPDEVDAISKGGLPDQPELPEPMSSGWLHRQIAVMFGKRRVG